MMTNLYWWETAFQLEDGDQVPMHARARERGRERELTAAHVGADRVPLRLTYSSAAACAPQGLASNISWLFGLTVVFVLSWVAINMFVAVICNGYNEVAEEAGYVYSDDEEGDDDDDVRGQPQTTPADFLSDGRGQSGTWKRLEWGNVSSHKLLSYTSVAIVGKDHNVQDEVSHDLQLQSIWRILLQL